MNKIENISFNQNINNEEKIISLLKNKKKSLPTQYLYDDLGSKLFEEICVTEEYYLTRTEKQILELNASDIVNEVLPSEIFEFGSGSSKKTKTLIAKVLKRNKKLTYFSFDISIKALKMSYNELNKISKSLHVQLIKGDFNNDIKRIKKSKKNSLYLFLGCPLGNFINKLADQIETVSILPINNHQYIHPNKIKNILNKSPEEKLKIQCCTGIFEALNEIKRNYNSGKVMICGSLYLAGEVLEKDGYIIK